jgi:hypothetical protein
MKRLVTDSSHRGGTRSRGAPPCAQRLGVRVRSTALVGSFGVRSFTPACSHQVVSHQAHAARPPLDVMDGSCVIHHAVSPPKAMLRTRTPRRFAQGGSRLWTLLGGPCLAHHETSGCHSVMSNLTKLHLPGAPAPQGSGALLPLILAKHPDPSDPHQSQSRPQPQLQSDPQPHPERVQEPSPGLASLSERHPGYAAQNPSDPEGVEESDHSPHASTPSP